KLIREAHLGGKRPDPLGSQGFEDSDGFPVGALGTPPVVFAGLGGGFSGAPTPGPTFGSSVVPVSSSALQPIHKGAPIKATPSALPTPDRKSIAPPRANRAPRAAGGESVRAPQTPLDPRNRHGRPPRHTGFDQRPMLTRHSITRPGTVQGNPVPR